MDVFAWVVIAATLLAVAGPAVLEVVVGFLAERGGRGKR